MQSRHVTLVASRFRDGGVEQRMTRLAAGLLHRGVHCTFLLGETGERAAGQRIPAAAEVVVTDPDKSAMRRALSERIAQAGSTRHAVLVFRTADYSWALDARPRQSTARPPLFLVNGDYISERLSAPGMAGLRAWKARRRLRRDWTRADGVITTCPEIHADWLNTGAFPASKIHAPRPPVVGPDVDAMSREPVAHPWMSDGEEPVVLAVGRLTPNKRFELLLEAFAEVRRQRAAKLVILGQGREKQRLMGLCNDLELTDAVDFPGFTVNPYAWMRRANVLVLPSRIEPFGLVLIESLYVGTPFIAAGAPPGPRAIHNATGCGVILEEDTAPALASAILAELDVPTDPEPLHRAASAYDSTGSAGEYLEILFPPGPQ